MNKGNYGLAKHRTYHPDPVASPSKYLFSYNETYRLSFDYTEESSGDYTKNVFDLLYDHGNKWIPDITGTYKFDSYTDIFKRGKALKIKGRFRFKNKGESTTKLNMNFGLEDNSNVYLMAKPNAGQQDHFTEPNISSLTPVDFEIMFVDSSREMFPKFQSTQVSGFYQYCVNFLNPEGKNDRIKYIPLSPNSATLIPVYTPNNPYVQPLKFHLDFDGTTSVDINPIQFSYLNIEVYER
jgi:hypothetical protein